MATFTLTSPRIPVSTSTSAYAVDSFGNQTGAAVSTVTSDATTGACAFTGLADNTDYVAVAGSVKVRFHTNPAAAGSASSVVAPGRAKYGGNAQLSLPGVAGAGLSTFTLTGGRAQYFPIRIETPVVIDQLVVEVTTAFGTTIRIGAYNADTDWQPTTLVAGTDAGTLDVSTTGVKTSALADTALAAGRYLLWVNSGANSPQLRCILGNAGPLLGYAPAIGGSPTYAQIYTAQAYAAAPSTGLVWDTIAAGSPSGFSWPIWLRVKTP